MHLALVAALWLSPVGAPKPVPAKKYATGAIPILHELVDDIEYDNRKAWFLGMWWWTRDPLLLEGYGLMCKDREFILKDRALRAELRQLEGQQRELVDEAERAKQEAEEKRRQIKP